MSEYRDTNYTLFNLGSMQPRDYFQQVKLEYNQKTTWRWVNVKYVNEIVDGFLEFKDEKGNWDGNAWSIIQISPRLKLAQVLEMQKTDTTIVIVNDDDVRDYKRWNK